MRKAAFRDFRPCQRPRTLSTVGKCGFWTLSEDMYKFLLIANCEQRLRYAYYFYPVDKAKRPSLEAALIKKCLSRNQNSCSFFLHDGFNIVYRRTGQLILIIGTDDDENNLAVYEFVRAFIQVLDAYFSGVTEKKIVAEFFKLHLVLQHMVSNGNVSETNVQNILERLKAFDNA
nr:AP-4 complex subunit sigma-1-like isoform X1 [Rhipicephalus microplus]